MIIAHLSDLHLGYRAYTRTTPNGVNQREADVASAVTRAFEAVALARPDLVLIAGDVFHSVRPSNGAIAEAFRALSRLTARLEGAPIVVIAGERDTPRSSDTTSILDLFREIPGVHVATDRIERFDLPGIDAEVVAAPHAALLGGAAPLPSPRVSGRMAVLVAHAAVRGALAGGTTAEDGVAALDLEGLLAAGWDYVGLGHHPHFHEIARAVVYSGSLERTSGDPWSDTGVNRGFVLHDTATGVTELRPVGGRPVVDLPRLSAEGRSPAELSAAIHALAREAGDELNGALVRLVVTDLPRQQVREIDQEPLRAIRSRALHFVLDARPPARPGASVRIRGVSLEQQVEEFLGGGWTLTMEGIDREQLVGLARGYLRRAEERAG